MKKQRCRVEGIYSKFVKKVIIIAIALGVLLTACTQKVPARQSAEEPRIERRNIFENTVTEESRDDSEQGVTVPQDTTPMVSKGGAVPQETPTVDSKDDAVPQETPPTVSSEAITTELFLSSIVSDYSTIEFQYDDRNELKKTIETTESGGVFVTDYSYDEIKKCVISNQWNESMEGSGYTINQWFFNGDYQIDHLKTIDSSDEISYTYYTYNSQGWVIHAKHEAALEEWCWEEDYSYEYDTERNPVSSSGFGTDDVFENGRLISSTGINGTRYYNYSETPISDTNAPRWNYTSILLLSRD